MLNENPKLSRHYLILNVRFKLPFNVEMMIVKMFAYSQEGQAKINLGTY